MQWVFLNKASSLSGRTPKTHKVESLESTSKLKIWTLSKSYGSNLFLVLWPINLLTVSSSLVLEWSIKVSSQCKTYSELKSGQSSMTKKKTAKKWMITLKRTLLKSSTKKLEKKKHKYKKSSFNILKSTPVKKPKRNMLDVVPNKKMQPLLNHDRCLYFCII